MHIPNYDKQNSLFCKLKLVVETFEVNKPTNQDSLKSQKLVNHWLKRLALNLMNQPIKINKKSPMLLSRQIIKNVIKNFGD